MKNSETYDPTEVLSQIQRVEAPPFLLTRIRQRISDTRQQVSPGVAWVAGLSFLLVLALNLYIISSSDYHRETQKKPDLAQTMNLYPHNSLYE
jgi:hypothetical protein